MNDLIGEIQEKLSTRDKLFEKFKPRRLNIDWTIYNEVRNDMKRTIKQKEKQYLEEKLSENIAKPKQICQTLKSVVLPNKKQKWFVIRSLSIAETFKKYYSSLTENLVLKLPK